MMFMSLVLASRNALRRSTIAAAVVLLAGCADPALVQVSPGAYRIVKSDKLHFYRTTAELKADAVREANEFAAARGMVAVAITSTEQPLVPGVEFATVKYQFRLLDKGDPELRQLRRTSVTLRPMDFDKVEGPSTAASAAADIAALDEMRQRGVIEPSEFMTLRARLLAPASAASAPASADAIAESRPVKP